MSVKKILFIEDDPDQIFMYDTYFSYKKPLLQIIPATTGEEALRLALDEQPDFIMADILLHNENGIDIMAKIRKHPKTKKIPFVVLTALEKRSEKEKAVKIGSLAYIIKSQIVPSEIHTMLIKFFKTGKIELITDNEEDVAPE